MDDMARVDQWVVEHFTEAARVLAEYSGRAKDNLRGKDRDDNEVRIRVLAYLPGALSDAAVGAGYRYVAEIISSDGEVYTGNPAASPHLALDQVHYRETAGD